VTDPDFDRRLAAAKAEMAAKGRKPSHTYPLAYRLMHQWGRQARPPHYQGFARLWLSNGLFFSLIWGAMMYFLTWRDQGMPLATAAEMSILAGLLFGAMAAGFTRYKRKKNGLNRWEDL
jgi:hypothetical protein